MRGTRSVNTACEDPVPKTPPLGRHSAPHGADLGFREPLPPHLARPGRQRVAGRPVNASRDTGGLCSTRSASLAVDLAETRLRAQTPPSAASIVSAWPVSTMRRPRRDERGDQPRPAYSTTCAGRSRRRWWTGPILPSEAAQPDAGWAFAPPSSGTSASTVSLLVGDGGCAAGARAAMNQPLASQ